MRDERPRIEDVRGTERVQPEQLEMRRADRAARRIDEIRRVHPELARAVVADEPDALESGVLGHGRPEHHRLDPTDLRGDRFEPRELAR